MVKKYKLTLFISFFLIVLMQVYTHYFQSVSSIEIGHIYLRCTSEIDEDDPFAVPSYDTLIVVDKKDGYVKYMHTGSGVYGSMKEIIFYDNAKLLK